MAKGKKKSGTFALALGLGLTVAGVFLFFFVPTEADVERAAKAAAAAIPEEVKDAKVQMRSLVEIVTQLEKAPGDAAKAYAEEAKTFIATGTEEAVDDGLAQRHKWITALAKRTTEKHTKGVTHLTSRTFFDEVASTERLLTLFHSPDCVHCKNLEPRFNAAALEAPDTVAFASADVTRMRDISSQYDVSRLPTMLLFVHGRPVEAMLPNASKEEILQWVNFRQQSALTALTQSDLTDLLGMSELNAMGGSMLAIARGKDADLEAVEDAAEHQRSRMVFLRVVDDESESSSLELHNTADPSKNPDSFKGPFTYDAVDAYLNANAIKTKPAPTGDL